jgi:hypothetical protein
MRWGLVPSWWSKPLKELKLATFNARAETVTTKPFFRTAFKRNRCLIPVSGYYEWQDKPGGKQPFHRAQQICRRGPRPNARTARRGELCVMARRERRAGIAQGRRRGRAAAMAGVEASEQLASA